MAGKRKIMHNDFWHDRALSLCKAQKDACQILHSSAAER